MPGPETTVASVLSVPALTGSPQQSSSRNCTKPSDRLRRYKKSNGQLSSSSV